MRDLESSYRVESGRVLIEIEMDDLKQMFNTLDPAPFHKRDIDADAEEYIVGAARDIALHKPLGMVVYLPAEKAIRESSSMLEDAIRNYFDYRAQVERRELRQIFGRGWDSLAIGSLFLFACVSLQTVIPLFVKSEVAAGVVREGLLISGWVAMWRPIQIFLYDWRPIRTTLQVYRKLSRIGVEIRSSAVAAARGHTAGPERRA